MFMLYPTISSLQVMLTVLKFTHSLNLLNILFIYQDGLWAAEKVIQVQPKKVSGWALPDMPGEVMLQIY